MTERNTQIVGDPRTGLKLDGETERQYERRTGKLPLGWRFLTDGPHERDGDRFDWLADAYGIPTMRGTAPTREQARQRAKAALREAKVRADAESDALR